MTRGQRIRTTAAYADHMEFTVRAVVEDDWREVKALRLEMLQDTPIAYLETLASALAEPDATWQVRAARPALDGSLRLAAIDGSGRWIGTLGGFLDRHHGATLVSVYVTPRARGRHGIFDAMLDRVEDWARERGTTLRLSVHEDNRRAIAAYVKRGFVETGQWVPYPLEPGGRELEMIKRV